MSLEGPASRSSSSSARILVLSLIPLIGILPPESRVGSLLGASVLILVLTMVRGRSAGPGGSPGRAWIVVALVLAAAGSFAALAPGAAIEPLAIWILALAAGISIASVPAEPRFTTRALQALALSAGAVSVHALYQALWGLERLAQVVAGSPEFPDREAVVARIEGGRAFAGFPTPAALGGFLALALPVTVALALQSRGRIRIGWISLAALQLGAAAAAASATATAALLGATVLALVVWGRARGVLLAAVAVTILLGAAVVAQRGPQLLDASGSANPLRLRAANARVALEIARDNPWVGVGLGGYSEAYPAYRRIGENETRHAHDLPLELVAELGLVAGLGLSVFVFVTFLGPLWRERSSESMLRRAAAIGLAAFVLQNLADFTAYLPSIVWTAALFRGLLAQRATPGEDRASPVTVVPALAAVLIAAVALALTGVARDQRMAAREAAWAGHEGAALALAERAARLAPWDIDAAVAAARVTLGTQKDEPLDPARLARADSLANRAVRLSPARAGAREVRARIRLAGGDLPGALADLTVAARLHPARGQFARFRDQLRQRFVDDPSSLGETRP